MKTFIVSQIKDKDRFWKNFLSDLIPEKIETKVQNILLGVRQEGDSALLRYIHKFDHVRLGRKNLKVSTTEMNKAKAGVGKEFIHSLSRISHNIRSYQQKLLLKEWKSEDRGRTLGLLVRPIKRVGIYIPGGSAPLISTILMTVIPAQIAGVKELILATPPNAKGEIDPYILRTCAYLGIQNIYKMGGAHAIGAMAYGTQSIGKVDLIAGPGNIYVTSAKRQVFGFVGVDMVAGPSELMILADKYQKASIIAADILAQAEHDAMARTFLVTSSLELTEKVKKELRIQIKGLSRQKTAQKSLKERCFIFVVKDMKQATQVANKVGPEHLEILCRESRKLIPLIQCAGAVFVDSSTPEAVGDYVAGPSHVLPTGGTARFFSPLSSMTFLKTISYLQYSPSALKKVRRDICLMTELEGLDAHKKSLEARFK